jgi:hypothetical protein
MLPAMPKPSKTADIKDTARNSMIYQRGCCLELILPAIAMFCLARHHRDPENPARLIVGVDAVEQNRLNAQAN